MSNAIPKEATASLSGRGLYYQCPNGGFASLCPGICPKCHESLSPVVEGGLDGQSGGSGANMRGALSLMPEGSGLFMENVLMHQVLKTKRKVVAAVLAAFAFALTFSNVQVNAHGGEDHGAKKAPTVSTGANMVVRETHVGSLEVTIKHPPVEPDKELAARVFVTRFETNEPVEGAKVFVAFTAGGARVEATAEPGNTHGIYEVRFPPMPRGDYALATRVEVGGATQAIEFGTLQVAPLPPTAAATESSWARTALLALGAFVGLWFLGLVVYRATAQARRDRIKGEAATA